MTDRRILPIALAIGLLTTGPAARPARASDHADTAANFNRPGADLADVFIFPSLTNDHNVVLVMDVHPLIPAGQGGNVSFDPNVLYQFKVDVTGDHVEDLVLQVRFLGTGPGQRVIVSGPAKPLMTGTTSALIRPSGQLGTINQTFTVGGHDGLRRVPAPTRSSSTWSASSGSCPTAPPRPPATRSTSRASWRPTPRSSTASADSRRIRRATTPRRRWTSWPISTCCRSSSSCPAPRWAAARLACGRPRASPTARPTSPTPRWTGWPGRPLTRPWPR